MTPVTSPKEVLMRFPAIRRIVLWPLFALIGICPVVPAAYAKPLSDDPLANSFRNPPPHARPHTWWHWMDGNVTREGITADLEAMKKAGIGGAQMFHVSQGIPPGPVGYNTLL